MPESADLKDEGARVETRIVEVGPAPDSAFFNGLGTRRERLSALESHFRPRKEIILERLKGLRGVGVKDLSASNALIVTAPEETWLEIVREGGRLDLAWVRVHLNESVAGEVSARRARRGRHWTSAED
jgi:hypothetical protein